MTLLLNQWSLWLLRFLIKIIFYQYEVSSWSRDNRYSKHNMNYWMYGDYLGVGPGAHSKITTEESIKEWLN